MGEDHRLDPVASSELGPDVLDVGLHRRLRHVQRRRDPGVERPGLPDAGESLVHTVPGMGTLVVREDP